MGFCLLGLEIFRKIFARLKKKEGCATNRGEKSLICFEKTVLKSTIVKLQEWFKYKNGVELNFKSNELVK